MKCDWVLFGLSGWTILVCVVGLAASVVPATVHTDPFWGVRSFVDKELFAAGEAPGILVIETDAGSPVAAAGLLKGDRVLSVNGTRVEMETFRQLLSRIQPEEPVTLELKRGGQDLRLVTKGEIPNLEGVLFLDWQFVAAPLFLVLLVISIATQPLIPAPLWRSIFITLGGLAVITVTVITETTHWIPWTVVWRSQSVKHGFPPALHYPLTATALLSGLALSILGALAMRACLMRSTSEPVAPNTLPKIE